MFSKLSFKLYKLFALPRVPSGAVAIIPSSTNAAAEAEPRQLLVPGVSFFPGRMRIRNPDKLDSHEAIEHFMVNLRTGIGAAVASVMKISPDYMVMEGHVVQDVLGWQRLC